MKSALLHCCCAHCAAYSIDHWRRAGYEITAFWYNPNIHPLTEHEHRLSAMKSLAQQMNTPLIIAEGYDIASYLRAVSGHEDERCQHCFRLRLSRTAAAACEGSFTAFTTTLLISPHQKHELIKEIGAEMAKSTDTEFLYADLRKRYSDSRHITKPLNLYRQQYCGCVYSKWERHAAEIKEKGGV